MGKHSKTGDAERIAFVAPPGTRDFYKDAAELEGVQTEAWMRATLHREAVKVFEAHGVDTATAPPVKLRRPPRLQPREYDDGGEAG